MRIAHVSDVYFPRMGGIERQVHDLAVHQQAAGHDVEIITSVAGDPETALAEPVKVWRPPPGRHSEPSDMRFGTYPMGAGRVLAGRYDVVHVHASSLSPMAYNAAGAASEAGIPTAITLHSLWDYASPVFAAADHIWHWSRWPIAWSAVSSVAALPLYKHLGHDATVSILPNGVTGEEWRIDPLPRDPQRVVVGTVMRLAYRKRPRQYLAMLRRARVQVPDHIRMEAVIVGDGPRRAMLERYIARHDMGDWVTLSGRATHAEIREVYRDVDFFVAPATLESFGIAALEARCAGLPIIAQSVSGVRDFITHGREGLLATDDVDMSTSIARLVTDRDLRARMTAHNRRTPAPVSWPDVLHRCEDLYRRAGARVPAGAAELIEAT